MALSTIAGSSIDDDAITNAKIADSTINLTSVKVFCIEI